jgi:addiction module RelE/StbE family toxin
MYRVILTLHFKKMLGKLDGELQKRVNKVLHSLEESLVGEPLSGDLNGYYSVHFEHNRYRLVYYKEDDKIEILAVHVGKRTDSFYRALKKGVKNFLQHVCFGLSRIIFFFFACSFLSFP